MSSPNCLSDQQKRLRAIKLFALAVVVLLAILSVSRCVQDLNKPGSLMNWALANNLANAEAGNGELDEQENSTADPLNIKANSNGAITFADVSKDGRILSYYCDGNPQFVAARFNDAMISAGWQGTNENRSGLLEYCYIQDSSLSAYSLVTIYPCGDSCSIVVQLL